MHLSRPQYYPEEEDDVVMMTDVHTALRGFDKSAASLLSGDSERLKDIVQRKVIAKSNVLLQDCTGQVNGELTWSIKGHKGRWLQ